MGSSSAQGIQSVLYLSLLVLYSHEDRKIPLRSTHPSPWRISSFTAQMAARTHSSKWRQWEATKGTKSIYLHGNVKIIMRARKTFWNLSILVTTLRQQGKWQSVWNRLTVQQTVKHRKIAPRSSPCWQPRGWSESRKGYTINPFLSEIILRGYPQNDF